MTKLNISMPHELLEEIDAEASALGLSRSGLIQEASARYIVASRQDREAEVRRLRIASAAARMRRIGLDLGPAGDAAQMIADVRAAEEERRDS